MRNNDSFDKIMKNYVHISVYYKSKKNNALIFGIILLLCCIMSVYIILKTINFFSLNKTLEFAFIIITLIILFLIMIYDCKLLLKSTSYIHKNWIYLNHINSIYQFLSIRLQNKGFDNSIECIPWTHLLSSIFVFYLGFYFSNIFGEENRFTEDNIFTFTIFSFFVVLSSTLFVHILELVFNKNSLKYKCFLKEIEDYQLNLSSPATKF